MTKIEEMIAHLASMDTVLKNIGETVNGLREDNKVLHGRVTENSIKIAGLKYWLLGMGTVLGFAVGVAKLVK